MRKSYLDSNRKALPSRKNSDFEPSSSHYPVRFGRVASLLDWTKQRSLLADHWIAYCDAEALRYSGLPREGSPSTGERSLLDRWVDCCEVESSNQSQNSIAQSGQEAQP